MDSRFAHLYKRDSSVSMIRVKMSRRRSQSQKENREKMQNLRRHLDKLPELELSLNVSAHEKSVHTSQETGSHAKVDKTNSAAEERRKMLARFKENKALQKEKEKREKEKKGTFKVGLYRPQPLGYLPLNPAVPTAKKTSESMQSTRVTRSMKQSLQPKQPVEKQPALRKAEPTTRANKSSVPAINRGRSALVEPAFRAPTTRSVAKTMTASLTGTSITKPAEDLRSHKTKAANRLPAAPPSGRGKAIPGRANSVAAEKKESKVAEEMITALNPSSSNKAKIVEDIVTPFSFAPQGFVFQAPSGLRAFQPTPLSPGSADAFLSPSFSAEHQMELKNQNSTPSDHLSAPPCMSKPCPASVSTPTASPASSPVSSSVHTGSAASDVALFSDPPCAAPDLLFDPAPASPSSAPASLSDPSVFPASPSPDPVSLSDTLSVFPASPFPAPAPHSDPASASPSPTPDLLSDPASASPPPTPASLSKPPFSPSPTSVSTAPPPPAAAFPSAESEPQYDVSYFRAIMASETERLTGLSVFWELRFDDSAIPEEMRDRMRTAVGQARLLMKERFGQFNGLVDDCDFGRGEKITTCTDLQGFWDMVYFQVEDVDKKFNALKQAEARGWQEEIKPVTKQKKVVKKPPTGGVNPRAGAGASSAARSRLAAVKAAMKAKQAATKAAGSSDKAEGDAASASDALTDPLPAQTVVFHGGFFQVESPVKVIDAVRRSSRLRAAPCSPHGSKFSTPGRQKRSVVTFSSPHPCVTPKNPPQIASPPVSPAAVSHSTAPPVCTPKQHTAPLPCSPLHVSCDQHSSTPCASPNRALHTQLGQPEHTASQSDFRITPADDLMDHKPHDSTCQKEELPLSAHSSNKTEPEGNVPASPSVMSTTPQQVSPAPSDEIDVHFHERSPISADCKVAGNQNRESIAGVDFERYLQPTARCSLSPVQSMAVEGFSLGLQDAEMESPQAQAEEPAHGALMSPTALPRMAPLVVTPWIQETNGSQLLFTPEQKERVRQPVCERDLMMFTPPYDI